LILRLRQVWLVNARLYNLEVQLDLAGLATARSFNCILSLKGLSSEIHLPESGINR
jgi:hypothetical protein